MENKPIEIDSQTTTSETTHEEVVGTINGKEFVVNRWRSCDDNVGVTDEGVEFIEADLTEEEKQEVEDELTEIPFK